MDAALPIAPDPELRGVVVNERDHGRSALCAIVFLQKVSRIGNGHVRLVLCTWNALLKEVKQHNDLKRSESLVCVCP